MATIEREPTRYAHGEGHADLAMDPTASSEYPGRFITCGGDGEIRIWNGLEDDSPVAISLAADVAKGLAARPIVPSSSSSSSAAGRFVAGSADTHGVHAFDLPDGTPDGILTRFTADVNCLAYSPDGALLAAGAGDFQIKILRDGAAAISGGENGGSSPAAATTLTGHSAPILSLAFDPSGTRLASAACNGDVKIWDVLGLADGGGSSSSSSSSSSSRCVKTLGGVFPSSNDFDNAQTLCRLCWSKDGSSLLVPAVGGVKSFNADSWDFQFTFTEESLTVANVCSFSPCGKYLAVASTNGFLIIFDYGARVCVSKCETDKRTSLCALLWNPTVPKARQPKEIVVTDVEGNLGGFRCRLAPPSASSAAAASAMKKAKDGVVVENFQGLFEDDDDDGDFAAAASQRPVDRDDAAAEDDDDDGVLNFGDDDDGVFAAAAEKGAVPRRDDDADSVATSAKVFVESSSSSYKLAPPQESFQPSATPRHLSNRFMAWNSYGIVTQHKTENAIDVDFHDAAVHHAIHVTNDDDYVMADVNHNLVALASEGEGGGGGGGGADGSAAPSKLTVLTIGSWDSTKQWSVNLPEGEAAEAVAVGENWVAVATSRRMLRLFSAGGIQREVFCLAGPVVCMSGFESQLLVALHDGAGFNGDQKLALHHYRDLGGKPYGHKTTRFPIVLSPKATLEWLGFSFEGSVVTVDSGGVVRLAKRRFQNGWVQIADTRKNVGKSDHYFVIAVSERDAHIRCIFCKGCSYPAVLPKPLVQTLPVALSMVEPETDKSAAEASFWASASMEEHEETVVAMQEQLLKLVALSCKSERDFRSVEAASLFPSADSLQLAIKYASRLRKMNLAAKFGEIALRRRQEEEEEQAATAARRKSGGRWRRDEEEEEEEERPPDSQMSLFDDSPPPPPPPPPQSKPAIRSKSRAEEVEEEEEEGEEEGEEEENSVPLLQLEKRKSQKPLTPLVATATPQNASFKKNNNNNAGGGGNPFKKQTSLDSSSSSSSSSGVDGGVSKNVFAALAAPSLMKRASSFTVAGGNRFSKAAGKKGAGNDVIKPPPVKRKPAAAAAAASSSVGVKKTASLARSFAETQRSSSASPKAAADSIVTSTPRTGNDDAGEATLEDESPFAFWRRCNLEAILADFADADAAAVDDEDAVTQHCVNKFRELPTSERKEWIAKFNSQKQQSQKMAGGGNAGVDRGGNDAGKAAAAAAAKGVVEEEKSKKRKLDLEEADEEKEQKPPTTKSRLAAFAFAAAD